MASLTEFQTATLARAANDVAGFLAGCKIALYQSPIDILPSTPLATFSAAEATYTGYAQVTLVYATPSVADDGTVEVVAHPITFRASDAVTPNIIYGCFVVDSTGAILYYAGQFDGAPLPLQNALQLIIVTLRYRPATNSIVCTLS
jgi:hypothetical protein